MTTIVASCRYMQSDRVVARVIAGETLIVPVRGGVGDLASIYSLNELGSFLWRQLHPAKTCEELVSLVLDEYEVTPETAERDVQCFSTRSRMRDWFVRWLHKNRRSGLH